MYVVIHTFVDLQDNDYAYNEGDIYPRDGLKVSKERIDELKSDKNRQGKPLIKCERKKKEG